MGKFVKKGNSDVTQEILVHFLQHTKEIQIRKRKERKLLKEIGEIEEIHLGKEIAIQLRKFVSVLGNSHWQGCFK